MEHSPIIGLMLNYQDANRTISCIESLLDQSIETIVVWDNSADSGVSASKIREHFPDTKKIHIHISNWNLGFSAGVNNGLMYIKKIKPDAYVLLINNDARLLPEGAKKLCLALEENNKSVISFPNIDHSGTVIGCAYYHYWTGLLSWTPKPNSFRYASGCCLLIALPRISLPLFDEDFFMYGEDMELGWRLRNEPEALVHVPELLVFHEGSASSKLGSTFYEERLVACHLILTKKLASQNIFRHAALYALRLLVLSARAILRSYRFRSSIPLKALWRGLKIAGGHDPLRISRETQQH